MRHFLAAALLIVAGSAQAEPWVSTATRVIPFANAVPVGSTSPSQPVHVTVSLKLRNTLQLESAIARINTPGDDWYGQFLTPRQFAAMYSPTVTQALAVADYLKGAGFTDVKVEPNRTLVTALGTAAVAERAFNTTLVDYRLGDGRTVFAYAQPPMVPARLGGSVLAVLGLTNADVVHANPASPADVDPNKVGESMGAQDLQLAYNVGAVPAALNTTVAIFTSGNAIDPVLKDIARYKKKYKIPDFPVTVVDVGPAPSTDASAEDEWDMDTQTSTGLAGGVKELVIYTQASNLVADFPILFNRFAVDNKARAASASFGTCDFLALVTGVISSTDQALMQAAAQGQTVFVSSGDTGDACNGLVGAANGVPNGGVPNSQDYPSSSPYAVSVGGTTVLRNADGTRNDEVVWTGTGGGISQYEPVPSWQLPILPTEPVNSSTGRGRGVPDVAMDADFLLSPGAFYANGSLTSNGGTSLASPLALGAWARILEAHGGALGFASPALYQLATGGMPTGSVTGFNDVVVGNNGLYSATQGWDYTTGLGTFDISAVAGLIQPVTSNIHFSRASAGNACVAPGLLVNDDPAGDNLDAGVPGHDLRAVYVAEPYDTAGDKLVFTMDVDDLSNVPPNTAYTVMFALPDGVVRYVGYFATTAPDGAPSPPANPAQPPNDPPFFFGHEGRTNATPADQTAQTAFITDGALDAESHLDTANHRVVFVLSKSKIAGLAGAPVLSQVNGGVWEVAGALAFNSGLANQLDTAAPVDYAQVGNASCSGKSGGKVGVIGEGSSVLGAGSMPVALLLPMIMLAALRRRWRTSP